MAVLLHGALQGSDFSLLQPYIPTKQVYDKLMQLGNAPVRESLLLYLPDQIQNDFQKDFSQLLKDGALLEMNWAEAKIKRITADTALVKNTTIIPVKLEIAAYGLPPVPITFNVIRLDGKYYYLGPLQIPNKDLNTPQQKF
ncbi:hypothetical protein DP923_10270 [Pontibacter arcticus]|uniref:DUF3887 domain-containing protein n=2 Tax=Pontibacter arcticus TaxID=2080288 RepID=A0A364RD34_9BACT|nr:hypothetical protein DP923_10270 [Pontibacter arcticus]